MTSSADYRSDDEKTAAGQGADLDESVQQSDSGPIDDQDMAAAEGLETTPEQAEHYQEMIDKGAHQKGEGNPQL